MVAVRLPPAIDIPPETKRAILDGFKKLVAKLQEAGKFEREVTHSDVLHNPSLLAEFVAACRANPELCAEIVVGADGKPVTELDRSLACGVTLGQVLQLMVRTCARHAFMQDEEEKVVTRTVTTTKFLFFKETQRVQHRVSSTDPRVLKEILRFMAFDWQLPLLEHYAELNVAQLAELGENILLLRTPRHVLEFKRFDVSTVRKAKAALGAEFTAMLDTRPGAIRGVIHWPKDMYQFFRTTLRERFYDFMARDETFFMMVGTIDKPVLQIYGDVLGYIAKENLVELQRLNIDRLEVMLATMRSTFGPRLETMLDRPNFARDILRRQVEGLVHMYQDKAHLLDATQLIWNAAAPQVIQWLAKQQQQPPAR